MWHRVIIWRSLSTLEKGIQIDNNLPDVAPISGTELPFGPGYLLFGNNQFGDCPQSFDEMGYWIGHCWTAAERLNDWNGGAGRTYPNVPP